MKFYKVLIDGKSCAGGNMEWSLPKKIKGKWKPGKWHTVNGNLKMCEWGLHVTNKPYRYWYDVGCQVYEAEVRNIIDVRKTKTLVRSARLIRKCNQRSWEHAFSKFVKALKSIPWCKPDGKPLKKWKLFERSSLKAARNAAKKAAGERAEKDIRDIYCNPMVGIKHIVERIIWKIFWISYKRRSNIAWDAIRDAAWFTDTIIEPKLTKAKKAHLRERMRVWEKGYCLLCTINGVFYVYAKRRPK